MENGSRPKDRFKNLIFTLLATKAAREGQIVTQYDGRRIHT